MIYAMTTATTQQPSLVVHNSVSVTTEENGLKMDFVHMKKAAMILRAMNHKLRQQMIKLLDENKKMTVTDIYVKLRLEQSVASQHLAILRRAGIVMTERDGKFIYYGVNYNRISEVNDFVNELVG
ncbi:MAG: transcriptional regulator, ArsR family [Chitinophagaceae bacterium]|jgi:DNA-binding transcriptional ArsR family regulator|nr:transcriptional regulator, ArsR family [Chitinophagaceae bacterium]